MTEGRRQVSGIRKGQAARFAPYCLIPVFCLLLSGCGFTPIYASHANGAPVMASLNNVAIDNIPDREGQALRNHLIDRMYASGRPADPNARLFVKVRLARADLAIQKNATASRSELNAWASYSLKDMAGKKLLSGTAHSVVSFSRLGSRYGTLTAEESARNRAIQELGEQIVNRLSLYYAGNVK